MAGPAQTWLDRPAGAVKRVLSSDGQHAREPASQRAHAGNRAALQQAPCSRLCARCPRRVTSNAVCKHVREEVWEGWRRARKREGDRRRKVMPSSIEIRRARYCRWQPMSTWHEREGSEACAGAMVGGDGEGEAAPDRWKPQATPQRRHDLVSVPKIVLLVLCSYHTLVTHAGGDRSYKVVSIDSLKSGSVVCFEADQGLIVPVTSQSTGITADGPCSALEEILRRDQLRAAHIQRKFYISSGDAISKGVVKPQLLESDDDLSVTVPVTLGSSVGTLEYVITVGIGSPAVNQTVLIDTSSDVPWVQCEPCSQCHPQVEPLFAPSASATYTPVPCGSATCTKLQHDKAGNGCSNSECRYYVQYGDGSRTNGTYSSDTLTLGSGTVVVAGFQFGCGHVDTGMSEKAAGLMALGGGAQSLVSQTAGRFGTGTGFSYCLPPTSSASSGFLKLGLGAGRTGRSGFVKTEMIRSSPIPTYYGLRLQAIRVGGKQLDIPASAFSAGMVVDSGAVISRLPPTAHAALTAAFEDGMKEYQRAPATTSVLNTCYDFSGQDEVTVTTVALVFAGDAAVVELAPEGILLERKGYYCLAFAANSDDSSFGVLGNVQQRTIEVLYDIDGSSIGFKTGAC